MTGNTKRFRSATKAIFPLATYNKKGSCYGSQVVQAQNRPDKADAVTQTEQNFLIPVEKKDIGTQVNMSELFLFQEGGMMREFEQILKAPEAEQPGRMAVFQKKLMDNISEYAGFALFGKPLQKKFLLVAEALKNEPGLDLMKRFEELRQEKPIDFILEDIDLTVTGHAHFIVGKTRKLLAEANKELVKAKEKGGTVEAAKSRVEECKTLLQAFEGMADRLAPKSPFAKMTAIIDGSEAITKPDVRADFIAKLENAQTDAQKDAVIDEMSRTHFSGQKDILSGLKDIDFQTGNSIQNFIGFFRDLSDKTQKKFSNPEKKAEFFKLLHDYNLTPDNRDEDALFEAVKNQLDDSLQKGEHFFAPNAGKDNDNVTQGDNGSILSNIMKTGSLKVQALYFQYLANSGLINRKSSDSGYSTTVMDAFCLFHFAFKGHNEKFVQAIEALAAIGAEPSKGMTGPILCSYPLLKNEGAYRAFLAAGATVPEENQAKLLEMLKKAQKSSTAGEFFNDGVKALLEYGVVTREYLEQNGVSLLP